MNTAVITDGIAEMSPRAKARLTGAFYLLTILTGLFAQAFISERLVASGDAAMTATNILTHEPLFRLGFTKDSLKNGTEIVYGLPRTNKVRVFNFAAKAGLDEQRTLAIVMGRWTPSPAERDQIAAVFGLTRDQIVWGHTTPIQHIYGSGPA